MQFSSEELRKRYLKRITGARDNKVYIGPEIVSLRTNNTCNLSCKFCWIHAPGNPSRLAKPQVLGMEKFKEIIEDCIDLEVDQIHIIGDGEPTIHPDFPAMMAYLENKPIKTKLLTNGTFPPDYCLDVIKADHVLVDLSAVNPEHYVEVQGKNLFDRVVSNIKTLVSLRDKKKPAFLVDIAYIVNTLNVKEKPQMVKLAKELGVNAVDFKIMNEDPYNKKIALPGGFDPELQPEGKKTPPVCLNGWFYMGVSEKTGTTCCLIPQMGLGALSKDSLKNIWLSPKTMKMRLLGKYGRIQKMYKACQSCSFYDDNVQRENEMQNSEKNAKVTS